MFKRNIEVELLDLAKGYPVVTLLGPRQSGKTTLVKGIFKHKKYANLEELDVRNLAINDPKNFLNQFEDGAILDEIQRAPQLL
ncbi:MAG: AAA family ATPase [Chlamydiae bacterium]|nr:AAA family ATPase [Chlamydiota bacterium]